jgi:hypothetical protein
MEGKNWREKGGKNWQEKRREKMAGKNGGKKWRAK